MSSTVPSIVERVMARPEFSEEHLKYTYDTEEGGQGMTNAEQLEVFRRFVTIIATAVVGGRIPTAEECGTEDRFYDADVQPIIDAVNSIIQVSSRPESKVRTAGTHSALQEHVDYAMRLMNAAGVEWTFTGRSGAASFVVDIEQHAVGYTFVRQMVNEGRMASSVVLGRISQTDTDKLLRMERDEVAVRLREAIEANEVFLGHDDFVSVSVQTDVDGTRTAWLTGHVGSPECAANLREEFDFASKIGATWEEVAAPGNTVARHIEAAITHRTKVLHGIAGAFGLTIEATHNLITDAVFAHDTGVRVQHFASVYDADSPAIFGVSPCSAIIVRPQLGAYVEETKYTPFYEGSLRDCMPPFKSETGERPGARQIFSGDPVTLAAENGMLIAWPIALVPYVAYFCPKVDKVDFESLV